MKRHMLSSLFLLMAIIVIFLTFCKGEETKMGDHYKVLVKTNMGEFVITLREDIAPKTVENFVKLVDDDFYDGLIFHRVISGFVAQGGDPDGNGTGGPGYTLPAEIHTDKLSHEKGVVAMARQGDNVNPERRSSGSQFYICLNNIPHLNGAYTTFGRVTEGIEVVDKIGQVKTGARDKPVEDLVMEDLEVIQMPKSADTAEE